MKLKLLLLLLVCQGALAQRLLMNSVDKNTGTRTILTNNSRTGELGTDDTVVRNGMVFFSAGYQKVKTNGAPADVYFIELNIVHKDNRLGCLKNGESKIILTFKDGTKAECSQISDTDCDAVGFIAAFALMPKKGTQDVMKQNFEKLLSTDVTNIELFTSEKSVLFNVKNTSKPIIKAHFALLDKTIKASL